MPSRPVAARCRMVRLWKVSTHGVGVAVHDPVTIAEEVEWYFDFAACLVGHRTQVPLVAVTTGYGHIASDLTRQCPAFVPGGWQRVEPGQLRRSGEELRRRCIPVQPRQRRVIDSGHGELVRRGRLEAGLLVADGVVDGPVQVAGVGQRHVVTSGWELLVASDAFHGDVIGQRPFQASRAQVVVCVDQQLPFAESPDGLEDPVVLGLRAFAEEAELDSAHAPLFVEVDDLIELSLGGQAIDIDGDAYPSVASMADHLGRAMLASHQSLLVTRQRPFLAQLVEFDRPIHDR
jgi:hypothetical protein